MGTIRRVLYLHATSELITTLTLVNTGGSPQAENFITPMFGHPFRKGDIPLGSYPKFELSDGTNIPYTFWGKTSWSDGSWKWAGFMLLVPTGVTGTLTINVMDGGVSPVASSRITGDLSAQDLKMVLTGINNLSGVWTSALNQGIIDNDDLTVVGDGPAGKVWRIRQQYMQSGANHGQLECVWFAAALQNADGGLYGLRVLPRTVQPWIDVSNPAPMKRDFTAAFQNGASTAGITQPVAFAPSNYTITNGNTRITATGSNYQTGTPIRLSVVSAPFNTSTTYYTRPFDANSWQLHPTAGDALHNANVITPTANGSGTATPQIEIVQYASFFAPNSNGSWQYVQGGGSVAADATIRVQFNKTYWRSTRMVPPYDLSVSPTSSPLYPYNPMTAGPVTRQMGNTGERDDIAVQPSWVARHFLTQAAVDEQAVRVAALAVAGGATGLRRSTTNQIPCINNGVNNAGGAYTGLGLVNSTLEWNTENLISGVVVPSGDRVGGWDVSRTDHWPSCQYYAYLITGEPQYLDLMIETANYVVASRFTANRNFTVGGHSYYACCFRDASQARTDAWTSREVALGAAITPDAMPDGSAVKQYLTDMMTAGYQMINAYNAAQDSFWQTNGIYYYRTDDGSGSPWQLGYLANATSMAVAVTESADALAFLNFLMKFPNAVDADIGVFHMTAYFNRMRTGDAGNAPLVTAMNQIYWHPLDTSSWSASTDLVTLTTSGTSFALTLNDGLMWVVSSIVPGGLVGQTAYFAVNVTDLGLTSPKTCNVAASPNGAGIDLTNSGSDSNLALRLQVIPAAARGLGFSTTDGYTANQYASYRFAEAVGAAPVSSIRAKMDAYWANIAAAGVSFNSNPKNAMNPSF